MKKQIFLLIVLVLSCFSCKEDVIYHPLDGEFIEYFGYAKDGSWWILADPELGIRDSFYITDYFSSWEHSSDKLEGDCYQVIRYKLHSPNKISEGHLYLFSDSNDTCLVNYFGYASISLSCDYFFSFPTIIKQGDSLGFNHYDQDYYGIQRIPSYSSGIYRFENAIKVCESTDTFVFAPKVGLIRVCEHRSSYNYFLDSYYINE